LNDLLIVGAGGHGKVVADAAKSTEQWREIAFVDDRRAELRQVSGLPVVGTCDDLAHLRERYAYATVAVGDNMLRLKMIKRLLALHFEVPTVVHNSAILGSYCQLGQGTVVMANAVVNAHARMGMGCIINTAAVIEHDCVLGDAVHVCPNAAIAGGVRIGMGSTIGIGASVIQCIELGARVFVGAGSVVTRSFGQDEVIVGVPGRGVHLEQS